ncbi:MAG: hypothetical protein ACK4KW_12615 [Gemmobacter sp.]
MKRILFATLVAFASPAFVVPVLAQTPSATAPTFDQRLIDAAGHFETITEQAYAKSRDELAALLSGAETAVSSVATDISAEGRAALDAALTDLRSALAEGTPSRVAIASVEAYRALVNEVSAAHPIPKEVSLLDYAGFKIQALAQDATIDWASIGTTLDFADTTWTAISARVTDAAVRDAFAASLVALREAVQAQDKDRTLAAASVQLDRVDDLEKYFASH